MIGEVAHRYMTGLYSSLKELTERFPHILFEGCAAGGNRFNVACFGSFGYECNFCDMKKEEPEVVVEETEATNK